MSPLVSSSPNSTINTSPALTWLFVNVLVPTVTLTQIKELVPPARISSAQRSRASILRTSPVLWAPTRVCTHLNPLVIYFFNCTHVILSQKMGPTPPTPSFSIYLTGLPRISPLRISRSIHTTSDTTPQPSSAIQTFSPQRTWPTWALSVRMGNLLRLRSGTSIVVRTLTYLFSSFDTL
jgi:hypothetical protein